METAQNSEATYSIPSIIAVIAVVLSFIVGAFWGFVLAIIAIIAAVIGIAMSLAPSRRGGRMSLVALFAGGVALIAAVIKAIMWLIY